MIFQPVFFCVSFWLHLSLLQSGASIRDLAENTLLERKCYVHQFWGKKEANSASE